jgi:hypothetical protein
MDFIDRALATFVKVVRGFFLNVFTLCHVAKNVAVFTLIGWLPNDTEQQRKNKGVGGLIGIIMFAPKALWQQTVFSDTKFYSTWKAGMGIRIAPGRVRINTPKEPNAKQYIAAGGAQGEIERNKAKYLEMHDPNADKVFNEACEKLWNGMSEIYGKPFDAIEKLLPEIK